MFLEALSLVLAPSPPLPQEDDALTRQLVARCERAVDEQSLDGFAVVIDVGGEPVLARGWGRLPGGKRAQPTSVVRAEPLIDLLTVTAALKLVEAGELELQAPVSRYLPELGREDDESLQVIHLMDHTSGLIGWSRALDDGAEEPSMTDLVGKVAELGQQSPPGVCFEYSESNALVLGAIVEKVAEAPLADVIEERLLADAGLESTGFDVEDAPPVASGSRGAREVGGRLVDAVEGVHPFGEHELCSTPAELTRLARALGGGDVVSARMVDRMLQQRRLEDGTPTPVGLGLNRVRLGDLGGFNFGGSAEGTTVHVVRYPQSDLTLSLVVARERVALSPLATDLARLALGMALDAGSAGVELADEVAEQVTGTFQIGCTSLVVRRATDGRIVVEVGGSPDRRLVYLGAMEFADEADRDVRFEFRASREGEPAETLVMIDHGLRTEAVRLD